jgi:hypothetical protein
MKTADFDTDDYVAEYTAMMQPYVPDPIVAVGALARRGALRDTVVGKLSPAVYWSLRGRAKAKANGLPGNVLVAATTTSVHVFAYDIKKRDRSVTGEVARWDRAAITVDADQDRTNDYLTITLAEGSRFEFESMRGYDFNHALFAELLAGDGWSQTHLRGTKVGLRHHGRALPVQAPRL